ncbi:asparagine synthase B [Bacillus tianshenii]|nr:asparagine synthase B [Bacillus tianshenii]
MCGIFATTGDLTNQLMNDVLQSMKHRGPDEGSDILLENFHLGHQRLSIIGVEDGIQPIPNETKTKWIVCNGEIYNYKQLKDSLPANTTYLRESDSEVVLKLYEEKGTEAVHALDGMFAFFIADEEQNTFIAARDTLGIKPLYYGKTSDDHYVFASELKTLYLVTEDVNEFPAGYYFTPEEGFVCYNEIKNPAEENWMSDEQMITAEVQQTLTRAVRKRLLADVEVGVLLSGGLDSSLIAAIAAKYHKGNNPLKSFCVGSKDSMDIQRARDVAKEIGTEHHEYIYTQEELIEALPKVIYHLESYEPSLVRSALPNYFISKLAAEHVKVILSGEGADELFSGYAYLEKFTDTQELNDELLNIINTLHNINLQRADRMSMAHSLELRVPFLDLEMIECGLRIPAEYKIQNENAIEKRILRQSFEGYIPEHVLWRKKEEFSEGSGAKELMDEYAEKAITDAEFNEVKANAEVPIRSKQECLYYQIYRKQFPQDSALKTVGRWATA